MDKNKKYKEIFDKYNGVIKTSEFVNEGFHHSVLARLEKEGIIVKVKRGYYEWQGNEFVSDVALINKLLPEGVIFLNSALFIYGYIDRTPNKWHIAVDKNINKSRLKIDYPKIKFYFINKKYLDFGICTRNYEDEKVKMFDRDRTICDVMRYTNKMDKEIVNQAIRSYASDPKKNISKLMEYAKKMRIQKKVNMMIGMWM